MARKFSIATFLATTTMAVVASVSLMVHAASAGEYDRGTLLITAKYLFDGSNFVPGEGKAG